MNPLTGKRVLVTRPRAQAADLCDRLAELGMQPIVFPTIEIAPPKDVKALDEAIAQLTGFDWVVFTSVNGVAAFIERLQIAGLGSSVFSGLHVAAIGPATAQALMAHGIHPEVTPDEYVADRIPDCLGDVRDKRILLPRADIAREALAVELGQRGARVYEVAAYSTHAAHPSPEAWAELRRGVDVATFTSSSTVREFLHLCQTEGFTLPAGTLIACIGPITAQTARDLGLRVDVVAQVYTMQGLVQAIAQHYAAKSEELTHEPS